MKSPKVVCVYDGPSELTDEDILCFLYIGKTQNAKIGNQFAYTVYVPKQVQQYCDDMQSPSVCGDCPMKKREDKTCYVPYYQLVTARKWTRDYHDRKIPFVTGKGLGNYFLPRYLRLGMTGDPASVPHNITRSWFKHFSRVISYTHQFWFAEKISDFSRVSVNSKEMAQVCHNKGYRTARVIAEDSELLPNEVVCAAQRKPGVTCSLCSLCDKSSKHIAFIAHGKNKNKLETLV